MTCLPEDPEASPLSGVEDSVRENIELPNPRGFAASWFHQRQDGWRIMSADIPQREHDAIKTVAARLATAFPQTPAAHIDQSVEQAYHRFDGSRVRTFVPVLVEHAVRDELDDRSTLGDNSDSSPALETSG